MDKNLLCKNQILDLKKIFDDRDFNTLIEYVKENELQLLSTFLSKNSEELKHAILLRTSELDYFESYIEKNLKNSAIFKLGELNGFIHLLEHILYEDSQNKLAKSFFERAISQIPNSSSQLKDIILELSENSIYKEDKLFNKFSLSPEELHEIIKVLIECNLVNVHDSYSPSFRSYTLTDIGTRLAKQLKNE